ATVTSSLNPSPPGQPVTFTATVAAVAPGAGTATGTVTFKDGSSVLGTGSLQLINGVDQATFTTAALGGGSHTITAGCAGGRQLRSQHLAGPDPECQPAVREQPVGAGLRGLQRRRPGGLRRAGYPRGDDQPDRHRRPRQPRQPVPANRLRRHVPVRQPPSGQL